MQDRCGEGVARGGPVPVDREVQRPRPALGPGLFAEALDGKEALERAPLADVAQALRVGRRTPLSGVEAVRARGSPPDLVIDRGLRRDVEEGENATVGDDPVAKAYEQRLGQRPRVVGLRDPSSAPAQELVGGGRYPRSVGAIGATIRGRAGGEEHTDLPIQRGARGEPVAGLARRPREPRDRHPPEREPGVGPLEPRLRAAPVGGPRVVPEVVHVEEEHDHVGPQRRTVALVEQHRLVRAVAGGPAVEHLGARVAGRAQPPLERRADGLLVRDGVAFDEGVAEQEDARPDCTLRERWTPHPERVRGDRDVPLVRAHADPDVRALLPAEQRVVPVERRPGPGRRAGRARDAHGHLGEREGHGERS